MNVVFALDGLSRSEYAVFSIMITNTWSMWGNGAPRSADPASALDPVSAAMAGTLSPTRTDAPAISTAPGRPRRMATPLFGSADGTGQPGGRITSRAWYA